ncbi:MAG: ABC transporter permease [Blastocatellia bacterium]|nr:ABC transporter permease [Blastocatellia bacterium]
MLGTPSFIEEDEKLTNEKVVIVSESFWKKYFASDKNIIGKKLILNQQSYTVIGVLSSKFQQKAYFLFKDAEIWEPLVLDTSKFNREVRFLNVLAKLKKGITLNKAQAELDTISSNIAVQYPETNQGWKSRALPLHEEIIKDLKTSLLFLMLSAVFVLLIASFNISNLLLVRAITKQKETALRAALGETKKNLITRLLTESLLLAIFGGLLGFLLATLSKELLIDLAGDKIPRIYELTFDYRIFVFTIFLSCITGILFGIFPAIRASKTNLITLIKEGEDVLVSKGISIKDLLSIFQIGFTLPLLISVFLLIVSFINIQKTDPGFDPSQILSFRVSLPNLVYEENYKREAFYTTVLERTQSIPGVLSVGVINDLPFSPWSTNLQFTFEGYQTTYNNNLAEYRVVNPEYFKTMKIPVLQGRSFTNLDTMNSPQIAIISSKLAKQFLPNENPIGKKIILNFFGKQISKEIIGVVGDIRHESLQSEFGATVYVPYPQQPTRNFFLVIRASTDQYTLLSKFKKELWLIDKNLSPTDIKSMNDRIVESFKEAGFRTALLLAFSILSIFITLTGLYGVTSHFILQKKKEIGIRIALGATSVNILEMVLTKVFILSILGILLGIFVAIILVKLMSTLVFGITTTTNFYMFIIIPIIFLVTNLLVIMFPAWLATKIDPITSLRS